MKKKFSKILGIGLVVALLASFLVMTAPVSALTQPSVVLTQKDVNNLAYEISKENIYSVTFTTGAKVLEGGEIVVVFEPGTDITGMTEADVKIDTTAGLGGDVFTSAAPFDAVVTGTYPAAQTLTITPGDGAGADEDIGNGAIVQLTIGLTAGVCVTNPNTAGTYNLTVATQTGATTPVVIEAAVTSADYVIKVPTIAGLPGVASVYNPVGVLMAQKNSLVAAVAAAGVDYTIQVGPGTYTETSTIVIGHEGLTLVSTAGAPTTIIDATTVGADVIQITADEVTVDGFTIEDTADGDTAIKVTGDDVTVINNIFTATAGYPEGISIEGSATGATVSSNELDIYHTMMVQVAASDCTLSGNIFDAGINLHNTPSDITITGNTLIGSELWGIVLWAGGTYTDILIEGNTISETTLGDATGIYIQDTASVTGIQIIGNDITDNEGDGIRIVEWNTDSVIKFNTITGNDTTTGDYGIQNDTSVDVDASFNWWGTTVAADIAAMVKDTSTGDTTYEPFLAGTVEALLSATKVGTNATSLDASTTVGVNVSAATAADVISVAKYIANPEAAIAGAIAFYDVYVAGTTAPTDDVTIKFYAGDANTDVYLWSIDTDVWVEVTPVGFSAFGGYVYVTVDASMLSGTPFALVGGAAAAITAPEITVPVSGDDTVSLTPIFAWDAVAAADGYYFQLADNANFVAPLVKLDGDFGRLIVTAYAYVTELPYSKAYYWRVKAVSGTEAAGDLAQSAWSTGVFITKAEPEEPAPPVVIEDVPTPVITIEQPDITIEIPEIVVPLPAETPITPTWIYVIIAVGAVLVIALLVLIVRTRRVA